MFTNKFVSPLSSRIGTGFYKYYLMDTLQLPESLVQTLTFTPFNSESFGFTGHLYVMLDCTYFVKRAVMNFPQKINLNFVDYMKIEQNLSARKTVRGNCSMKVSLRNSNWWTTGRYLCQTGCVLQQLSVEPDCRSLQAFRKPEKVIEETSACRLPKHMGCQPPKRKSPSRKRLRWTR